MTVVHLNTAFKFIAHVRKGRYSSSFKFHTIVDMTQDTESEFPDMQFSDTKTKSPNTGLPHQRSVLVSLVGEYKCHDYNFFPASFILFTFS